MIFPFTPLGTLSSCVYVDPKGSDQTDCGIRTQPCRSLFYTINNVSRPNDKICLIASPIKQIKYSLEKPIVIKHNLTVTKSPLFTLNPVIIYPLHLTSNWKEFYAFTSFRSADADEMLGLKIKSVNFNVNIFTALCEGRRHPLSLSITDSIISSPNHAVHLTDLSGYENISIHVKDSIIQNGRLILENKRKSCKSMEHVTNIIELSHVTIFNERIAALNVNGCFNVTINKLKCSNVTWKIQELFMFKGNLLKLKNIIIENVLVDNNQCYRKALFLIDSCAIDIQNVLIKNCKRLSNIRLHQTFAVFIVQNSFFKMQDMEVRGNSIGTFMIAESKSHISIQNSVFINNHFTKAIYVISDNSNLGTDNSSFLRNNMTVLLNMASKSRAIIKNYTLTENNVAREVYRLTGGSIVELNYLAFTRNNIEGHFLLMVLNCRANVRKNKLTGNSFLNAGYKLLYGSSIQLNDSTFTRNNFGNALVIMVSSSVIINNNTLAENNPRYGTFTVSEGSAIQLNDVAFIRNNIKGQLMRISNSSAFIQNNTFTENTVSSPVYALLSRGTMQLNDSRFARNNFITGLLNMSSSCNAFIQNNLLTENNVSSEVYFVSETGTVQLNDVTFTGNKLKGTLLNLVSGSRATVKNYTMIGNNVLNWVFYVHTSILRIDTISLHNNTFMEHLMFAISDKPICQVFVSLMRIRENRFISGIIHIKNCVGRLADTYIENDDHFSVTAISVICSNKVFQKLSPFEFSNNKIIWNNKLLFSVRPIIELGAKVIMSNVNVSVASIREIEVMRYPEYKVYSNVYISSLFITCTKANVKYVARLETFRCIPCAQNTYTLNNASFKISSRNLVNKTLEFQNESTHFTCFDCPVGANCTEYIKSKSNFYGYKTRQQEIKFLPCPWNFCCSANLCKTIDSCNKRRTGTLCGRCSKNNTESFLSTNCVSVNSCQNFVTFWLIYCAYSFSLATCLYYMKDLIVIIKTTGSKVSKVFRCFLKEKRGDVETELVVEVVGAEEHLGKISHFTVSGIFALLVSFYQVKQVMAIDVKYKHASSFSFVTFISKFTNLEIIAINSSSYCPMNDLNAVSKAFVKTYLLTAALIMTSLMNYFVSRLYYFFGGKLGRTSSLKPSDRLGVSFIRVMMLNYTNMASVSLILLNCVEVAGIRVLHVNGDTKCFEWWQIIVAVFFFTWILFFPLSLKFSYAMFMKDQISFPKFIICLMIPLTLVVYKILNRNALSVSLLKPMNMSYVKRILKEMFEEPYRLKRDDSEGETIFYETWRLYQRVLLAIVATHCINPLVRIASMTPIIILIAISYRIYRPYKPEMYILHWTEFVSILGFFVCLIHNMFRGFLYVYNVNYVYPVTLVWEIFSYLDLLFSPIWVLIYFFIIKPIYNKVKDGIRKKM